MEEKYPALVVTKKFSKNLSTTILGIQNIIDM
jgi:hypothetical protein